MMVEWTEQDLRDAHRLLRVLDERSKKTKTLAGSGLGPAEIQESSASPLDDSGQSLSANSVGSAALKGSGRQSTATHAWEDGSGCELNDHAAPIGARR